MFTSLAGNPDVSIVAEELNPAVSTTLLKEIKSWQEDGSTMTDVITRLRQRTVPSGYTPNEWQPGMCTHFSKNKYLMHCVRVFVAECQCVSICTLNLHLYKITHYT